MSVVRSVSLSVLCAALVASTVNAASPDTTSAPDALVDALRIELKRSAESLSLPGQEKPYYVEYTVLDTESFVATASFGAVVQSRPDRNRSLRVDVRVGSYDLDNSAFVGPSMFGFYSGFPRPLVLDDDVEALRHDVWLATDAAYKEALEQLARKKAALESRVDPEPVPDFSREKPTVTVSPGARLGAAPKRAAELVRRLSAIFRTFASVQDSSVKLQAVAGRKITLNSEGTLVVQPVSQVWLLVRAASQAADGMRLKDYRSVFADGLDRLPSDSVLEAEVRRLGQEMTDLAAAPVVDEYIGPILFAGQATSELFGQVLAPHLSGQRPPVFAQPQMAASFPKSELLGRVKRLVLPPSLTVLDDPTRPEIGGQRLAGTYAVDDQGTPARPVTLVEKGVLKTLLMSRRPSKEISQSNGHGRSSGYGAPSAQIGNLLIQSSAGKSFADLKKELLDQCVAQGLEYGLIVRALDVPALTGRDPTSFMFPPGRSRESLTPPLLVYKIRASDGREELVRGASLGELTVRTLREIVAAGNELEVENRASSDLGRFDVDFGSSGAPNAIVAPAVLFPELEVSPLSGSQQKPAVLPHPYFAKK